ncbi:MAG: hypothetical protein AAB783_00405 [Patescibacteria group bacterium]
MNKQPFSLYTYYLIAVLLTLIVPVIIAVALPDNDVLWLLSFPCTLIGILLIGYLKWNRYRRVSGLNNAETVQYGLGSFLIPSIIIVTVALVLNYILVQ